MDITLAIGPRPGRSGAARANHVWTSHHTNAKPTTPSAIPMP